MIISKDNAEHYVWGDICDGWHLVKTEGVSVIHERMPAGAFEVRHYHCHSLQFFFVLKGTATLEVDGTDHALEPHQGFEVAPGVPHQMMNQTNNDVEFLVVSQPKSHGDRISMEGP